MAKATLYSTDGKASGEVELPPAFDEPIRPDLIARAAIADQTQLYQPKGNDVWAGMKTSARYQGRKDTYGASKNHGMSMLPREILPKGKFGRARRIPSSVKGRRAHPPKVEERLIEKINKKEYAKALHCALAASASRKYVLSRGHKISEKFSLPIIIDGSSALLKTKDAQKMLEAIGIGDDLARGKNCKKRSGVGSRKGGLRRPKTILIVVSQKEGAIKRAAKNIAGVDVVSAGELRVLDLAPGAKAGRLAAYTKAALEEISKR